MVGLKGFSMPSCCNCCEHWSFNSDDEPLCDLTYEYIRQFDKRQNDCPLVETYTKADMVAMLEDLLMEIKHTVTVEEDTCSNEDLVKRDNVLKVIQFRINKLKAGIDGSS